MVGTRTLSGTDKAEAVWAFGGGPVCTAVGPTILFLRILFLRRFSGFPSSTQHAPCTFRRRVMTFFVLLIS